ncbi:MAG: hypothetical protein KF689_11750 [Gemmatimonadaceae bacterium]|nr:hypothetical protein [Gemmatimonadaceae bacterium]MCW5827584.1 hypothetical protein [Gemmatimonadaceae bacterium]
MKIWDVSDLSFEVPNGLGGRLAACRVPSQLAGASLTRRYRPFRPSPDDFCEFRYRDTDFIILEMFGDNSRFLVAATDSPSARAAVADVRTAFAAATWLGSIRDAAR